LYKFFEDSTVDLSQWRVVLNLLEDTLAPKFDDSHHAGICTEVCLSPPSSIYQSLKASQLKFLYVAITRARKNLWIVDCSEKSEPMRVCVNLSIEYLTYLQGSQVFWSSRNEIQNCTPGTDVPRLAVSSSPEEWENSGRTLFTNKRYLQAMHCFERAGMERETAVAHTYYLREQARATVSTGSKQSIVQRHKAFLLAGEAFIQCASSAVNNKSKTTYLRNAGACFEDAQEDLKAAEAYKQAREYTKSAKLYRKCARFDEAVAIVTQNTDDVDDEVVDNIIEVAKLFYFKGGELGYGSLSLFHAQGSQLTRLPL